VAPGVGLRAGGLEFGVWGLGFMYYDRKEMVGAVDEFHFSRRICGAFPALEGGGGGGLIRQIHSGTA
jgi:hypothetical protein